MEEVSLLKCPDCNESVAGTSVYLTQTEDKNRITICVHCSALLWAKDGQEVFSKMSKEEVHELSMDSKDLIAKALIYIDNMLLDMGLPTPKRPVLEMDGLVEDPTCFYAVELDNKLLVYGLPDSEKIIPVFSCLDAVHPLVEKLTKDGKTNIGVAKIVDGLDFLNIAAEKGFSIKADLIPFGDIVSSKVIENKLLN